MGQLSLGLVRLPGWDGDRVSRGELLVAFGEIAGVTTHSPRILHAGRGEQREEDFVARLPNMESREPTLRAFPKPREARNRLTR